MLNDPEPIPTGCDADCITAIRNSLLECQFANNRIAVTAGGTSTLDNEFVQYVFFGLTIFGQSESSCKTLLNNCHIETINYEVGQTNI